MTETPSPRARRPRFALLVDYYGGDYQMGLVHSAEEAAQRLGYDLFVVAGRSLGAPQPADRAQNDVYNHLTPVAIDGVAVGSGCIGIYQTPEVLAEFCRRYGMLPLASISTQLPGVPSLVVNNRRGQQLPVAHLIEEHRCQRVAYVRGPAASEEAEERFAGYRDALEQHRLPFDPTLVEEGNFWIDSGATAMQRLLDRGAAFDGLVAANDYMAIGAMGVLKGRGIRIPHTVRVAGFDDVQSAVMASPSLTTVRQPLARLGALAIECLHDSLRGVAQPHRHELDVELVRRQSCGCGYRVRSVHSSLGERRLTRPVRVELAESRQSLYRRLVRHAEIPAGALSGWANRLLTALTDELAGVPGRFLLELEDLLDEAQPNSLLLERFYTAVLILRTELSGLSTEGCSIQVLDDIWHAALLLISDATRRSHLNTKWEATRALDTFRDTIERLSTALSPAALAVTLERIFAENQIRSAAISLFVDEGRTVMRPLVVHGGRVEPARLNATFASNELAPPGFFREEEPQSFVVVPINFATEHLGIAVLESGAHNSVYMMLREQVGAALKSAALHRSVVQQTALRERAEREQLQKETAIAQQIQTAILPTNPQVPGFEIAATMLPAVSVGGDYFDVIPDAEGAWFGFGDVTGHGLLSGLVMLMIQSMVSASVTALPDARPSQLVNSINRALFGNVRHRLGRDDHATFTLIRYERGGQLTLAGAHEVVLIVRARSGRCESLSVPGFWLGAIADVTAVTSDLTARLEPGDLLVLFTDGITEAMDAAKEQFGLERLVALLERHRAEPPRRLCELVLEAAQRWAVERLDDMTLLVARYSGSDG